MSPQVIIFLFFSFLGFLLSILFFIKKDGNRFANRILGIYTLLFSYEMTYNCLKWMGSLTTTSFVHFNVTQYPLWLIYGPLVFIYVRSIINAKGFLKSDILFLIPPALMIALISPFYFLGTNTKLEVIANGEIGNYVYLPSYTIWVVIGFMIFYGIYTYQKFKDHIKVGFKEKIWLSWFVGSYFGFVFLFTLYIFLVRFGIMNPKYDYFIDGGIVFFIGMLTYFGFMQPDLFNGTRSLSKIIPIYKKYSKSGLSKALGNDFKNNLTIVMENKKPYLNCDLRMDELSEMINASRNHTSQIINEYFNLSFFDYINKYRIEEAKKLLSNQVENNLTITEIAYEVGFNNRASFYKAFKKFTNQNPSSYMKHLVAS